jgi:hypothetical protein
MEKKKKSKNPHAVALGRLGGRKGGKVRFAKLTPEQRSELGRKAVLARWAKERKSKAAANVIRPDKKELDR